MKNSFITIALFLFATMSSVAFAGKGGQSDGNNKDNTAQETSIDHLKCWEGSNAGNQHDAIEGGATDEDAPHHEVDGEICPPGDGDTGTRPPKHCTQDNKLGLKHKNSASGC